jgi:7-cyano-7-deazaguanine reductase
MSSATIAAIFEFQKRASSLYTHRMAKFELLECFPNPSPRRDYVIEHVNDEFTSLCPVTGHPDFGTILLRYSPDRLCVELKSLKLYYQSYRDEGIFYEAVTNRISEHLVELMKPRWLVVESDWRGRGGIRSRVTVTHGKPA